MISSSGWNSDFAWLEEDSRGIKKNTKSIGVAISNSAVLHIDPSVGGLLSSEPVAGSPLWTKRILRGLFDGAATTVNSYTPSFGQK